MLPSVTLHVVKEDGSFRLVFHSDPDDGTDIVLAVLALLGSDCDFTHATLQDALHAGNAILRELGIQDIVHQDISCEEQ